MIRYVALQQSDTARTKFMAKILIMAGRTYESACDAKRNKFGHCTWGIHPVQKRLATNMIYEELAIATCNEYLWFT